MLDEPNNQPPHNGASLMELGLQCIVPTYGGRSFSILKRIKNYLRNSFAPEHMVSL